MSPGLFMPGGVPAIRSTCVRNSTILGERKLFLAKLQILALALVLKYQMLHTYFKASGQFILELKIFKDFLPYGRGGHIGHLTWTV